MDSASDNDSDPSVIANYFGLLCPEIILEVTKHVGTFDLIQFCEAYKQYEYCLKDLRVIDFNLNAACHTINVTKFLTTAINPKLIQSLNINGIDWIQAPVLKRAVSKMINLKHLYAIDTELRFHKRDIAVYDRTKIETLAVNSDCKTVMNLDGHLLAVKKLLLKNLRMPLLEYDEIMKSLDNLEEFWIVETAGKRFQMEHLQFNVENRKFKTLVYITEIDFDINWIHSALPEFDVIYKDRTNTLTYVMLKRASTGQRGNNIRYRDLHLDIVSLRNISVNSYLGFKETLELYLNQSSCPTMKIYSLNFFVNYKIDYRYSEELHRLLTLEKFHDLKSLSITTRCLEHKHKDLKVEGMFKRRRIGVLTKCDDNPLLEMSKRVKNLEELKIWTDENINDEGMYTICAYSSIGRFEKLKKLTVEIHRQLDGKFLEGIFHGCKQLEFLRLFYNVTDRSQSVIFHLLSNIEQATNLKELWLYMEKIPLTELLNKLSNLHKLERLYLECNTTSSPKHLKISAEFLKIFLNQKSRLIQFSLIADDISARDASKIRKILKECMKVHVAKSFTVESRKKHVPSDQIGFISTHQMKVGVMDIYLDFR